MKMNLIGRIQGLAFRSLTVLALISSSAIVTGCVIPNGDQIRSSASSSLATFINGLIGTAVKNITDQGLGVS